MTMTFIEQLIEKDKELFLWINDKHLSWLDPIMLFISSSYTWAVVCVLVIAFLVYKKGRIGIWGSAFLVLSLGMNSIVNYIVKVIVARPRPINNELFDDVIHAIQNHEHSYSFYSSHSSNSFCLVIFTALFLRNKYYTVLMSFWAVVVAYSRVYVGKHYPLDILVGTIMGCVFGYIGYRIYKELDDNKLIPKL
ncbi:phosphatase PAP2 family protein [Dysgonomonas sp. 25]|uniref:phosphatase PAP2 family protein n=1 Tax=Dysgonomonas sp. 25 TaxID=2302933 RepID=UPI0013CFE75C|nr:phosphatase PAP2 family protein [Dysgonomonas sp. 25]NDV69069.1 phosphatase PAP2 family protein [Dysgonomonas sp. 25]